MNTTPKVVIVGAGIAGLLTARALLRHGYRALLFDRADSAREASWSAAGLLMHIPPWGAEMDDPVSDRMCRFARRDYRRLVSELAQAGIVDDLGLSCTGCIIEYGPEERRAHRWSEARGEAVEERVEEFPSFIRQHLNRRYDYAYFPRFGGQIRPPRLLKALRLYLSRIGARFIQAEVLRIEKDSSGYAVVVDNKGREHRYDAGIVINCAGSWSNQIEYVDTDSMTSSSSSSFPTIPEIKPIGGHILRYRLSRQPDQPFVLGAHDGRYVIGRGDGTVIVGSNHQSCGFDKTPQNDIARELRRLACRLLPILENLEPRKVWVGLRPKDSRGPWPVLYRYPDSAASGGCYIHGGHFHSGIMFAPATAYALVHWIRCAGASVSTIPPEPDELRGIYNKCIRHSV